MTDLKNGVIDLGNITLDRNSTLQDFESVRFYGDKKYIGFCNIRKVIVEKTLFDVDVYFYYGKVSRVVLNPVLEGDPYPDAHTQNVKKCMCLDFLKKRLGEPTTNRHSTVSVVMGYTFDWGTIDIVVFIGGNSENEGGIIDIRYKKELKNEQLHSNNQV